MSLFKRKKDPQSFYTEEQLERRRKEIPISTFIPKGTKNQYTPIDFSDLEGVLEIDKIPKAPFPPSIEYKSLSKEELQEAAIYKDPIHKDPEYVEGFLGIGNKITRKIKQNFASELVQDQSQFEFDVNDENAKLSNLIKQPELSSAELLGLDMASPAKVEELTRLHMKLYSVLSKIQETVVASDFKTAYDIQDRIAYVLDNQHILIRELVDDLIVYLTEIIRKLEKYSKEIHVKQLRFLEFNNRVSKLKEYRYKTDPSFQLLKDNKEIANQEIEKNLKILGEDAVS